MQLNFKQLDAQLNKHPSNVYLVSTNEDLLAQEARQKILSHIQKNGFNDKRVLHVERGFSWGDFDGIYKNRSLFSEKLIIDIRIPNDKLDAPSRNALLSFIKHSPSDLCLIITTKKLSAAEQKSAWFSTLKKDKIYLPIWPISQHDLPNWIALRARQKQIRLAADAVKFIAYFAQGNLHAADQTLEKLSLTYSSEEMTVQMVKTVIVDNAVFNVFDLVDNLLTGNAKRLTRILNGLAAQGDEPILVLWAITKELRQLTVMINAKETGQPVANILSKVWQSKKPYYQSALKRLTSLKVYHSLKLLCEVDAAIKGVLLGDPWQLMTRALLSLCETTEKVTHA